MRFIAECDWFWELKYWNEFTKRSDYDASSHALHVKKQYQLEYL